MRRNMMNKLIIFTLCPALQRMVLGKELTLLKIQSNSTLKDRSTVYSTVELQYRMDCAITCAQDHYCQAATYNLDNNICSMSASFSGDIEFTEGNDLLINMMGKIPVDCGDLPLIIKNGVYDIYPVVNNTRQKTAVYCDIENGGWTVMQRRRDITVNFVRTFTSYKHGFGDKSGDYWIGNEILHHMLSHRKYRLRFELEDWTGNTTYAEYDTFFVGNEDGKYTLTISGYSGTAGDSITNPYCSGYGYFSRHALNGSQFSTFDQDNDGWIEGTCAGHGGWWMNHCSCANVNGLNKGDQSTPKGHFLAWLSWQNNAILKSAMMKIKNKT